jgi:glyoxylase-like metal-dependent hydrolase (beta-lactamase superfamily II)
MQIVQTTVGFMEVFCYLVFDEPSGESVLIDPAGDEDRLLALLRQKNLTLRYIVNTHGHADHTCGNALLKAATGAPIVMHAFDDAFFRRPENQEWAKMMGFTPSPPADIVVQDGDELPLAGGTMKFLHTPGHTPGACCILIDGNLFTGDTLFIGAVGRTDLPGSSFAQLLESLKSKILPLPPETMVWPGHDYGDRPHAPLGDEISTNPYITDFL